MADKNTKALEREYVIPLRRFWVNVPHYERTGKAIKTIKKFIAKHMKVTDRDVNNVRLDVFFNNEMWQRGRTNPPAKVKVKAIKEGELVKVTLADMPERMKFHKARVEKMHKKAEKAPETLAQTAANALKPAQSAEGTKTEEQKIDEKEKEKATAEANAKIIDQQTKTQKHTSKVKEESYHRMALKK